MQYPNLVSYISKIDRYNKEELKEEYNKINIVLRTIYQEYQDREETIHHLSRQLDEVRNRLASYENETI